MVSSVHTALGAFHAWWLYGLFFATAAQVSREKREERVVNEPPTESNQSLRKSPMGVPHVTS